MFPLRRPINAGVIGGSLSPGSISPRIGDEVGAGTAANGDRNTDDSTLAVDEGEEEEEVEDGKRKKKKHRWVVSVCVKACGVWFVSYTGWFSWGLMIGSDC